MHLFSCCVTVYFLISLTHSLWTPQGQKHIFVSVTPSIRPSTQKAQCVIVEFINSLDKYE